MLLGLGVAAEDAEGAEETFGLRSQRSLAARNRGQPDSCPLRLDGLESDPRPLAFDRLEFDPHPFFPAPSSLPPLPWLFRRGYYARGLALGSSGSQSLALSLNLTV